MPSNSNYNHRCDIKKKIKKSVSLSVNELSCRVNTQ